MENQIKQHPVIQILAKLQIRNYFELEITLNYFFELWLSSIYSLNYTETYCELDSKEATHCDHCHLICCVYIKGHVEMVDTKDQSNAIVYCACYVVC